eukprot:TRINITY_DN6983_c0_g1_i3.p1 TRINITY_DN6983_c0_g1~~TRINITY_DN6983_c0_g1_i3.p1  ORF type:complete len:407 (+),score=159.94 TRINITY_DN6983_c0_g1_i3:80-1222(+)
MAAKNVQTVCQVLGDADLFNFEQAAPESARAMLVAALPHATGEHSYQKEMLNVAQNILESAKVAAVAEASSFGQQAEAMLAEIEAAKTALAAATTASEEAAKLVEAKVAALKGQKSQVKTAVVEEKSAANDKARAMEARDKIAQMSAKASAVIEAAAGGQEAGQLDEILIESVMEVLVEAKAEKTLLDCTPAALSLTKEERGQFDDITIAELNDVLGTYAATLSSELAEAEKAFVDISDEALGCEALRDVEQEREAAAEAELIAAREAAEARVADVEQAKTALETLESGRSNKLIFQVLGGEKEKKAAEAVAILENLLNPPQEPVVEPAPEVKDVEMAVETEASGATVEDVEMKAVEQKVAPEQEDPMREVLLRSPRPTA